MTKDYSNKSAITYKSIATFFKAHLSLRTILTVVIIVILCVTLFYGWQFYRLNQEKKISYSLNIVLQQMLELQEAPIEQQQNFLFQEKKDKVKQAYFALYQKNKTFLTGLRALMFYAHLNLSEQNYQIAADNYERVYNKSSNALMQGSALYLMAFCQQELRNYDKAIAALTKLEEKYPTHFYTLEGILDKGRLLLAMGKYQDAFSLYQKTLQKENILPAYQTALSIDLNILKKQARLKNIPLAQTNIPQSPDTNTFLNIPLPVASSNAQP